MLGFFLLVYCLSSATCSEVLIRHRRTWIIDSFEIEEEHPGPFPYKLGTINVSRKYQVFFELTGEGVNKEPKGVLSIHRETGTLYVHKALDYEEKTLLKLKFEARKSDLSSDTRLGVEVNIRDINDNPPRFQKTLYVINVKESSAQGSTLLTVLAYDRDQRGTPNSTFHYEVKSVSPNLPDSQFFTDKSGQISFKGCLNYEVAKRIILLVEAKDHGEVISLSSSTTVVINVEDGNNHLPIISGQTGTGKVKEDETGSSPLRLHVTDRDSPKTQAWRVKYTIHGDDSDHFSIETDPDTNDGVLTVVKVLDFEKGAQRELSILVENQAPYFSCKVKERTSSGLWKLDTSTDPAAGQPQSIKVVIEVEDVNDPPVFSVTVKEAQLEENAAIGTWVEKVTAVDPDMSYASKFVYKVGHDPAGWVTVDPHTGDITTVKTPDRESPHVIDGLYTVLMLGIDNGNPPMTGTATLQIHVTDQNDNVPQLAVSFVELCLSDSPTTTNITAFDLDGNPFGGPFTFELLGNVKGKWKLNPTYGYTAGLVKEPNVYAGYHTVDLKISDMQGTFGVYNLNVTVCDCSETPTCRNRQAAGGEAGSGVIAIAFVSLLLFLFLLLLAVGVSCKKEFIDLKPGDCTEETLIASNIEIPGKDCKLPDVRFLPDTTTHNSTKWQILQGVQNTSNDIKQNFSYKDIMDYNREDISYLYDHNWNQTTWNSLITASHDQTHKFEDRYAAFQREWSSNCAMDATLSTLIQKRLSALWAAEHHLDYDPHLYAEEGSCTSLLELDNIISDENSFQDALKDLGPRFNQLASICKLPAKN